MDEQQEKLASYTGGLHVFRSYLKEKWGTIKEGTNVSSVHELKTKTSDKVDDLKEKAILNLNHGDDDDYSHVYRRKSRMEMVRISAAVMGIEFCYAAETAFVSPTLLKIGVRHRNMTLIWCLSPFIGFFLTPILGSLSDNCRSKLGRRRPFIILLSIGIILGLILVPNGKLLGQAFGDTWTDHRWHPAPTLSPLQVSELMTATEPGFLNASTISDVIDDLPDNVNMNITDVDDIGSPFKVPVVEDSHSWGIFFTILGTMLLDFDADACQSPSRAYLLDVTVPEDHAVGLSTFTVMAGLGGGFGYALGAINWDVTIIGWIFGGHVRAVFTLVLFIFIACVTITLYSFREIPLEVLQKSSKTSLKKGMSVDAATMDPSMASEEGKAGYGAMEDTGKKERPSTLPILNGHGADVISPSKIEQPEENSVRQPDNQENTENETMRTNPFNNIEEPVKTNPFNNIEEEIGSEKLPLSHEDIPGEDPAVASATLRQYLLSIVYMPKSLRNLCITNLFCWMSLVCYSLYFTDFVGEAVFGGDPGAPDGTELKELYEAGVRFGCWGMCLYSLSCSVYSFLIESLVKRFGARPVYICGQLVYSVGMMFMAALRHPAAVIIFSCSAGIMYSTLFTMPYLLVAHYHVSETFKQEASMLADGPEQQMRGLGTDVAIVSAMVFLAQFILSSCMGSIIASVGSTTAVICAASVLAACGAVSATQVVYLDL